MSKTTPTTISSDPRYRERHETFACDGPITAFLRTRSGDIQVATTSGTEVVVRLRTSAGAAATLLEDSEIAFDSKRGELRVTSARAREDGWPGGGISLGRLTRAAIFGGSLHDVDVLVELPASSTVEASSRSGDVALQGLYGPVEAGSASGDVLVATAADTNISTASGDIRVEACTGTLTARTASGDIAVEQLTTGATLKSASGDVRVGSSAPHVDVATASGDVAITATSGGSVVLRSVSGDIAVAVRSGLEIDVTANSVSGRLHSAIPLDDDPSGGPAGELVSLSLSTVSGDVNIRNERRV